MVGATAKKLNARYFGSLRTPMLHRPACRASLCQADILHTVVPVVANFAAIPLDLLEAAIDQDDSAMVVLFPRHALSDFEKF